MHFQQTHASGKLKLCATNEITYSEFCVVPSHQCFYIVSQSCSCKRKWHSLRIRNQKKKGKWMCLNGPGSMGAEVDTVIVWSSIEIFACSTRPTSQGSGAYTDLVAPGTV